MPKKITIEPVTRVEGHGKVTVMLDDFGNVRDSRLHIVEFRGFERFVQGNRNQQISLHKMPWNMEKIFKTLMTHVLILLLAFWSW